jgi:TonB family protein
MLIKLLPMTALLYVLLPQVVVGQNQDIGALKINNIKLARKSEIQGTFIDKQKVVSVITRKAEKGTIIEVRVSFYIDVPTTIVPDIVRGNDVLITGKTASAAGPPYSIGGIKLSGKTIENAIERDWTYDPIAVGNDTGTKCDSYRFLDSAGTLAGNGYTVSNGEFKINKGKTVPLCVTFPAPDSIQGVFLLVGGNKVIFDDTQVITFVPEPSLQILPAGIFRVGGSEHVSAPQCVTTTEPDYTDEARKAKINGKVLLDATVRTDGSIEINSVMRGLGYGLDAEAKKAAQSWKCVPAKLNGNSVPVQIEIVINFILH